MGMFGGGGASIGSGYSSIGSVTPGISINGASPFAEGGYASGWALVGERGPELVNFSQPGRIYNAEQTSKALSNGAPTDIKVVIENRSGQQIKATSATAEFNLKDMIINVVVEAVGNNDGGINNILKGALG